MTDSTEFDLNEEQKISILYHLLILSQNGGEIEDKKLDFIQQSSTIINFNFDKKNLKVLLTKMFKQKNNTIINEIPRSVKEWFVLAMYSLVMIDDKNQINKLKEAIRIAKSIGISETEYILIVEKSLRIFDMFQKDK
jgi:hypothetical protein